MSRISYLYYIENKINGSIYIGKSMERRDKNARWIEHKRDTRKDITNMPIHHAIRKYGEDNFEYNIFSFYNTEEEAFLAKIDMISYLKNQNITLYNVTNGGEGASFKRGPRDPAHTAKLKCFSKGHVPWNIGKHLSIETRSKVSKNIPNRKINDQGREEIKSMYATGHYSQYDLSEIFGVGQNSISRIINNKTSWVARGRKNPKITRS